jgi:hypothetical protein
MNQANTKIWNKFLVFGKKGTSLNKLRLVKTFLSSIK